MQLFATAALPVFPFLGSTFICSTKRKSLLDFNETTVTTKWKYGRKELHLQIHICIKFP